MARWGHGLMMLTAAALAVAVTLGGCAKRSAPASPPPPKPQAKRGVPPPTEQEVGIPFFPGAQVHSFSLGVKGTTDVAVTLETAKNAEEVASFYHKKCNWPEKSFKGDNAKIVAFSYEGAGVRREITITEDFETGKTTINLFRGKAEQTAEPRPPANK